MIVSGVFDEFPEEIQDDVDGLMWLGYLEEEILYCGHKFVLRTLKTEEDLLAGLLAKEYIDSAAAAKAWASANVALALVAIDGNPDFCPPLGPDLLVNARAKLRWVTENWYWPLIDYLFACYGELVQRQRKAIGAVEDLSSGSLSRSTPSPDSLTNAGDSPEQTSTTSN